MPIGDISAITPSWLSSALSHALDAPELCVTTARAEALRLNAAYNAQLFRLHIHYDAAIPGAHR